MNGEHRDDDERIDFSALDPQRASRRWEAMVQHTLAKSTPPSMWEDLQSALPRARVTLAALAAVSVLTWLPALLKPAGESKQNENAALAMVHFHEGSDLTAMLESADGY
ncbi:MAG: hypothetical protein JNM17_02850 [Archangium sp.]|nr:hypothetical protein [Archangium sp.]